MKNTSKEVIDIHIHFGTPDSPNNDCYWSEAFTKTAAFLAIRWITKTLFKDISYQRVRDHLFKVIHKSKKIQKVVLLALDQVYDENGALHKDRTNLHTSNRCLFDLREQYKKHYGEDKILVGASIHPYREESDLQRELEYCIANGAVLCKWIPSSQLINPSHPRCNSFYKKLVQYGLPLLVHTGPEHAIPTWDRTYNKYDGPEYLRTPLEKGVTVIAAHCGLPYFGSFESDAPLVAFIELMREAEEKNWNLYGDLSAICVPFRNQFIDDIKRHIGADRLVYGSDYPIPISELSHDTGGNFKNKMKILFKSMFIRNALDKNHYLVNKMDFDAPFREAGIDRSVFTNACDLLRF